MILKITHWRNLPRFAKNMFANAQYALNWLKFIYLIDSYIRILFVIYILSAEWTKIEVKASTSRYIARICAERAKICVQNKRSRFIVANLQFASIGKLKRMNDCKRLKESIECIDVDKNKSSFFFCVADCPMPKGTRAEKSFENQVWIITTQSRLFILLNAPKLFERIQSPKLIYWLEASFREWWMCLHIDEGIATKRRVHPNNT